jgi:hypothetical protein
LSANNTAAPLPRLRGSTKTLSCGRAAAMLDNCSAEPSVLPSTTTQTGAH